MSNFDDTEIVYEHIEEVKPNPVKPKSMTELKNSVFLWGQRGAGKSSYIIGLNFSERYGWKIRPSNRETVEFWNQGIRYFENKEFMEPTVGGVHTDLKFDFIKTDDGDKQEFCVTIPEVAGEDIQNYTTSNSELIKKMSNYLPIIFLIDPLKLYDSDETQELIELLRNWFSELHISDLSWDDRRIAICLTKMDLPQFKEYLGNPKTLLLEKLGFSFKQLLEDFVPVNARIKFFSTSVTGFDENGNTLANLNNNTLQVYPPKPWNLMKPLLWALDKEPLEEKANEFINEFRNWLGV